jgi:hypothetical protein
MAEEQFSVRFESHFEFGIIDFHYYFYMYEKLQITHFEYCVTPIAK